MPASTSSNMSVGVKLAALVMTAIAKLIRASSPPEATLETARGLTPGWPATWNSICSDRAVCLLQALVIQWRTYHLPLLSLAWLQ